MNIDIQTKIPTAREYLDLNLSVDWHKTENIGAIEAALETALACFSVYSGDELIGFVRVVGDNSICFYIQDLIVSPEYQRKGIGSKLMDAAMAYIREKAAPRAYVGLMAAESAHVFYEKWGFTGRPSNRPGMDLVLTRE